MTLENHYQEKSLHYGVANTRLRKIMELVGNVSGKRVLDIGCARGYIGALIKERGNFVAGIEISRPAAEEAKKVLDEVYVCDIERDCPSLNNFDLAILPEVLEHVFDPAEVLKKIYFFLNDNGKIIITTPNILLWTNRIKILFGIFRYTDQGLMDFGHIRFFTYRYLKEVLKKNGFEIVKENHIIFPGKLTQLLRSWPSLFASQFIIKAQKIATSD